MNWVSKRCFKLGFNTLTHSQKSNIREYCVGSTAAKIMAQFFSGFEGVIFIDVLPRERTVTGEDYANLTLNVQKPIKEKRRGKFRSCAVSPRQCSGPQTLCFNSCHSHWV